MKGIMMLLVIFILFFLAGYNIYKGNKEVNVVNDKTYNINNLLEYKSNNSWDFNKKELTKFMKKYKYCSKNTTKADITALKDRNFVEIKCDWWFNHKFIQFLNKYNYFNANSDRVNTQLFITIYKDKKWTKEIKYIKNDNEYKKLYINL